jgi:hypothetical protein
LVAAQKVLWGKESGQRPAVWSPGERLGEPGRVARVLRGAGVVPVPVRRFAIDERTETTFAMLAECFEVLGGVRSWCWLTGWVLEGRDVANRVVPTPDYARLAGHYGHRPDFCVPARSP